MLIRVFTHIKSVMKLQRAMEYYNYDMLFDFLNPYIKNKNIAGKVINSNTFTQIICRNTSGLSFELQVNWDKDIIKFRTDLVVPVIPFFVISFNDKYNTYHINNKEWLRNIIDSVLLNIDEEFILR